MRRTKRAKRAGTTFAAGMLLLVVASGLRLSAAPETGVFPQGMVAFVVSDDGACPSGWDRATYAEGRMILSVAASADAMKSSGEPIADQTDASHGHGYDFSVSIDGFKYSPSPITSLGTAGTMTLSGTTVPATSGYPFVQLGVCEVSAETSGEEDGLPYATIAYFNGDSCPPGGAWTPSQDADGRFLLPIPEGATSSGRSDGHWSATSAGHTHDLPTVSVTWNTKRVNELVLLPQSPDFILPTGALVLSGVASEPSVLVPFVSLLTCEKTEDTGEQSFTEPVAIFMGSSGCPDGWESVTVGAGRFVFGLPTGGTQKAVFGGPPMAVGEPGRTHAHAGSGEFEVPSQLGYGGDAPVSISLVSPGSTPYSLEFESAGDLPFYTTSLCQPAGALPAKAASE